MNLNVSDLKGNFGEDLKIWAGKVVEYCNPIAEEIDKAFYAFQSKPIELGKIEETTVLILGINPHCNEGEGCFSGQINHPYNIWKAKDGKITAETFCNENPCWKDRKNWPTTIWKNIEEKIFHTPEMKEVISSNNFVFMNALYFATTDVKEFFRLKNANNIFDECVDYTKFLIQNIIKPKYIICLSIPECFDRLNKTKTILPLLTNGKIRLLVEGKFCDVSMFGIPHTSGSRNVDAADWYNIGTKIHNKIFDRKVSEINAQETVDYFRKNPLGKITENSKKTIRFTIDGIRNDKLEVVFTTDYGGYWGIKDVQNNDNLQHKSKYIVMLKELGLEIYYPVWLGEKWFKCYGENIKKEIESTIEKFISHIKNENLPAS